MAHTKSGGSSRNGRDSAGKRLGVKLYGGQPAKSGSILIRQRGSKFFPGDNTRIGSDDTIYSIADGIVTFTEKTKKMFNGLKKSVKVVSVL